MTTQTQHCFSEIRVWTFGGDLIYSLSGHTSFVYSLSVLPSGGIVSSGEDRTVRVWQGNPFAFTSLLLTSLILVWPQMESAHKRLSTQLSRYGPSLSFPMVTSSVELATAWLEYSAPWKRDGPLRSNCKRMTTKLPVRLFLPTRLGT